MSILSGILGEIDGDGAGCELMKEPIFSPLMEFLFAASATELLRLKAGTLTADGESVFATCPTDIIITPIYKATKKILKSEM
ncbi:hypothetical protein D3C73_651350 [compost metagenome]